MIIKSQILFLFLFSFIKSIIWSSYSLIISRQPHLYIILITSTETHNPDEAEQKQKGEKCYQATFLLSLIKSIGAFRLIAMPISQSHILLVSILL